MNIGVIGLKGAWSSEALSSALQKRGAGGQIIELSDIHCDMNAGEFFDNAGSLERFDGIIIKKMGRTYTPALLDQLDLLAWLNRKGLPIFSGPDRLRDMISRLGCTLRLREHDIPMPKTLITENLNVANDWVQDNGPSVFKPLYSTKARGMKVIHPGDQTKDELKQCLTQGQSIIYLQQFNDLKGQDHGLIFLDGDFLGAYSRVGDGSSWNTTTNHGGKYQKYEPSQEIIDLAYRAQAIFGLDFCSVDVAITNDGPIIFEVSAFGGYRGLFDSASIDVSHILVNHVISKLKS